jgi:hypothetical protein
MMVDQIARQVNDINHRQERMSSQAEDFVAGVIRERTPASIGIAAVVGRALSDQIVADGWTAVASAVTAMLRHVPEGDRPAVLLGLAMMVDEMMALPNTDALDDLTVLPDGT